MKRIVISVLAALTLVGCKKEDTGDFVAVTDITGVSTVAEVGKPLTLAATVSPTDATNQTIAWSVKDAGATGASVSGATLNALAAGTVTVTATIAGGVAKNAPFTKDFSISVKNPADMPVVTGVSVSPSNVSVAKGKTQKFTTTVTGTKLEEADKAVNWTVTGGAKPGTAIATDGTLTIAEDETAASLAVKAISVIDATKSGTATVTVTEENSGEQVNIYIAGYYSHSQISPMPNVQTACYWVNETRHSFYEYQTRSTAEGIFVNDGKIYISGHIEYDITGPIGTRTVRTPCYWVDGVRRDLPSDNGYANKIFVANNKVYIAGMRNTYSNDRACFWVDDGEDIDQHELDGYDAIDIKVSNGKVYIAGRNNDSQRSACYWIDDGENVTKYVLPGSSEGGHAECIYVEDGNIYIAGFVYSGWDSRACYWINNGTTTKYDFPAVGTRSWAYSITKANGKLYTVGRYYDGSAYKACYWVDGVRTDLNGTYAGDIAVVNDRVFISGYAPSPTGGSSYYACYWVDGVYNRLSTVTSVANGIFVEQVSK